MCFHSLSVLSHHHNLISPSIYVLEVDSCLSVMSAKSLSSSLSRVSIPRTHSYYLRLQTAHLHFPRQMASGTRSFQGLPPSQQTRVTAKRAHRKSRAGCVNCKARRVKVSQRYPTLMPPSEGMYRSATRSNLCVALAHDTIPG